MRRPGAAALKSATVGTGDGGAGAAAAAAAASGRQQSAAPSIAREEPCTVHRQLRSSARGEGFVDAAAEPDPEY